MKDTRVCSQRLENINKFSLQSDFKYIYFLNIELLREQKYVLIKEK